MRFDTHGLLGLPDAASQEDKEQDCAPGLRVIDNGGQGRAIERLVIDRGIQYEKRQMKRSPQDGEDVAGEKGPAGLPQSAECRQHQQDANGIEEVVQAQKIQSEHGHGETRHGVVHVSAPDREFLHHIISFHLSLYGMLPAGAIKKQCGDSPHCFPLIEIRTGQ